MFNLFRKKRVIRNDVFGEVKLWTHEWATSVKVHLLLWGKKYKLNVGIVDDFEEGSITTIQEDTFLKFINSLDENQHRIENIISDFFEDKDAEILSSKFIPYKLLININGECAVLAENMDDDNSHDEAPGIAVVVYPKMRVFTSEAYQEYVFFGGDDDIKRVLYEVSD